MHCNSCRKLLETTAWVAEGLQPASCAHSLWSKGEDRHPRMYPHWVDSHIVQLPPTCECAACAQPQSCHCCITPILRCQTVHPHCRQQGKKKKKCWFWIRFAYSCSNSTCRLPQRLPRASTRGRELVLLSPLHLPLPAPRSFCPRRQALASRGQCQALKWAPKEGRALGNRHKRNASQTLSP